MKPIATLLLLLIAFAAGAQQPLTYSRVVDVDSTTKEVIYERALKWFTQHTTGSKASLTTQDKDKGEISAKMAIPYESAYIELRQETKGYIWFTLSISCKDNKYRYEFTNFTHEGTSHQRDISNVLFDEYIDYQAVSFGLLSKDTIAPQWMVKKNGRKWAAKVWAELKTGCRASAIKIMESLHAAIETPLAVKKDDW